jgi:hypothetical protein
MDNYCIFCEMFWNSYENEECNFCQSTIEEQINFVNKLLNTLPSWVDKKLTEFINKCAEEQEFLKIKEQEEALQKEKDEFFSIHGIKCNICKKKKDLKIMLQLKDGSYECNTCNLN